MIPKHYFDPDEPGVLRILTDQEWRAIGITQSLGWEHYEVHGESNREGERGEVYLMTRVSDDGTEEGFAILSFFNSYSSGTSHLAVPS